jgi:hypothetical protein
MEDEIIYEKNGKRFSRTQLEEHYGSRVEEAISKFGFTQIADTPTEPQISKIYSIDGKNFSREQLEEQYGERTDEAITNFGFTEISGVAPVKKKDDTISVATDPSLDSNGVQKPQPISSVSVEKSDDEEGLGAELWRNLRTGSTRLGSSFASLPETIYNVFALPQNIIAAATGADITTNADKFKENIGAQNLVLEYYNKETEKLSKETEAYNEKNYASASIYENIKEGNYSDAFSLLGSGITTSAPVSLSMMAGGFVTKSAGALAAVTTPLFVEENLQTLKTDNPEMTEAEAMVKAVGMAGAETVFASINEGTLGSVYRGIVLKEGKERGAIVFKDGLISAYKQALEKYGMGAAALGEGVEEVATSITQNLIQGKPALENTMDAFIQGIGGGALYGSPMAVKKIKNEVQDAAQRRNINQTLDKTDFGDLTEVFNQTVDSDVNDVHITIAGNKTSRRVLEKDLKAQVKEGEITEAEMKTAMTVFDQTHAALRSVEGLEMSDEQKVEVVNLIKRKHRLEEYASGKDPILFQNTHYNIQLINERLAEMFPVADNKAETEVASAPEIETEVETELETESVYPVTEVENSPVEETTEQEVDVDNIIPVEEDTDTVQAFDMDEIGADLYEAAPVTESVQTEEQAEAEFINNPVEETAVEADPVQETTVETEPVVKPKKSKPFITKNKKYQIKRDADGKINIFNRRGRKPANVSNKSLQKYREEFIDNTNFDQGDRAIKEGVNIDGLDEAQYVADNSNNAQEIAGVLSRTNFSDRSLLDPKTEAIASAVMGGGVNLESFVSAYGHKEGITNAYFGKNGKSLDMIAMDVANTLHNDYNANEETVTVADIVKFIEEHPNGVKELTEQNPIEVELLGKFEQLTGLPATPRILEKIAAREGANEIATEPDVTGTDPQNDNWAEIEGEEYIEVENYDEVPFKKGVQEQTETSIVADLVDRLRKAFPYTKTITDPDVYQAKLDQINALRAKRGLPPDTKDNLLGFMDFRDNKVYLNASQPNLNTPIHEYAHLWIRSLAETNKELYNRGIELIRETEYYKDLQANGYNYPSEQMMVEEALATAIGDKGERIAQAEQKSAFKQFLEDVKNWLTETFFQDKKEGIDKLTLEQFLDGSLSDILGGKNLDIVAARGFSAMQHRNLNQTNLNNEDVSFKKIEQEKQDKLFLQAVDKAAAKLNAKITGKLNRAETRKETAKAVKNELVTILNEYLGEKDVMNNLTFGDIKRIASQIANADTAHGFERAAKAFFAVKRQADAKNLQSKWDAIRQEIKDKQDASAKQMLVDQIKTDLNNYINSELKDPAVRSNLTGTDFRAIEKALLQAETWKAHTKAMDKFFDIVDRAKEKARVKAMKNEVKADRKAELQKRKDELYAELKMFEKNFFTAMDHKSVKNLRKHEVKKISDRLSALKNPTPTNVRDAINELSDLFWELESKKIMVDINKILSRKLTKLEGGRRKLNGLDERQAKILLHTKTILKQMAASRIKGVPAFETDTDFYNELLAEYDALVTSTTMIGEAEFQRTQALHIALQIAKAKITTNRKDQAELLHNALMEITETWEVGKSRFAVWLDAKQKRIGATRKSMIDAANDKDGISQKSISERQEEQKAWVSKLASSVYNVMLGKGLGDLITTFRVIDTKGSKESNDSVWTDMHERIVGASTEKTFALRKHGEVIKEAQRRIFGIQGTQTEVYGEKNLSELGMTMILGKKHTLKVRNKPVRDIDNKVIKDENDEVKTESYFANFTESQLLNLWMHYQNPELKSKFDAAGYDADFMAEVDNLLSDKAKEYGEFLFDFYDQFYDGVNEVYKDMYGHSLGRPAKYAGKLMHDGFSEMETNLMDINKVAQTAAAKSTKERNGNSLPILAQDVNNSLARYLYEMEHFKAYAEVHQEFNSVIESPVFKRVLMDNHPKIGKTLLDQLVYYRDNDMVRGGKKAEGFEAMDFIMSNFVKSTLAVKPTIAITQTLSWTNAISFLPSGKYAMMGYRPDVLLRDTKYVLKNSKYIANRWDAQGLNQAITGLNTVTADQLFRDSGKVGITAKQAARAYDKIQNALMWNVKLGDMVGVTGSIPVYTGWKQKYLDQGYTEQRAEIKAMRKFEAAVERAQQSQTAYGKSMAQDHPAGRYFAMFATSVLQNYRNSMLAFLELYRHTHPKKHGKGSVGRHLLTIFNYRLFQPLVYTFVAQRLLGVDWLFDDDDRELVDEEKSMITALLLGNIQSVPLIGSVLTLLSDKVFMEAIGVGAKDFTYGGVLSNPLSDEGIKLEENIDKWAKADGDDEAADQAKAKIFKSVRKLLSGLPVETIGNYVEIMKDAENIKDEYDLTERIWMVLGKSKTTMDFDRETREKIKAVSDEMLEVMDEEFPLE